MKSLLRFSDPTAEQINAESPDWIPESLSLRKDWTIKTDARHHLTAHDKTLIRWCIEQGFDSCKSARKTVTLHGGDRRAKRFPTSAEITTRETNAFGEIATKTYRAPFTVEFPKTRKQKEVTAEQPELFATI